MISTDPSTEKVKQLHPRWWLMYAGNDVSPVFRIADAIERELLTLSGGQGAIDSGQAIIPSVSDVEVAVQLCVVREYQAEVSALYLEPMGYTYKSFEAAAGRLPADLVKDTYQRMAYHSMPIDLLVAGFDRLGYGYLITISGDERRIRRWDNPGYIAIGGGAASAMYWMSYRDIGYTSNAREVLYSAVEGKYFAELTAGVDEFTDVFILRADKVNLRLTDERIDQAIIDPICKALAPRHLTDKFRRMLNALPELSELPELELERFPQPRPVPE